MKLWVVKCVDDFCRNPVSRFEVIQLKKTLHDMLDRAGLNDLDEDFKGPSQVDAILRCTLSAICFCKWMQNTLGIAVVCPTDFLTSDLC